MTKEGSLRQSVEKITHNNSLLAIIISSDYTKEGIEFFHPEENRKGDNPLISLRGIDKERF